MIVPTALGPVEIRPRLTLPRPNGTPPKVIPANLRGFTIHYSGIAIKSRYAGKPDLIDADEAVVRQGMAYHLSKPVNSDVGYNFLIGRSGVVWQGRGYEARNGANGDLDSLGAMRAAQVRHRFAIPANVDTNGYFQSVYVSVGTDAGYDDVTPAQLAALERTLLHLADFYSVRAPVVLGHRDVRSTSCPGDRVYARLPALNALFDAPVPPKPTPPAPPTTGDDLMTIILAPKGCFARFVATADRNGVATVCRWLPTTPDADTFRAVGAVDKVCEVADLKPLTLLGPLPSGDPGHGWSTADFAVVTG